MLDIDITKKTHKSGKKVLHTVVTAQTPTMRYMMQHYITFIVDFTTAISYVVTAMTNDKICAMPCRQKNLYCVAAHRPQAETLDHDAMTHLRQEPILAADAVELAVVVQVVLQGYWPLQGARHKELPLLGAAHPVGKLHHVWDSRREQDEVDMRWKHNDHLHV